MQYNKDSHINNVDDVRNLSTFERNRTLNMNKYELAKDTTFYREAVIFTLSIILKWETLTFVGDYRNCSKCKMLKSVIWLQ